MHGPQTFNVTGTVELFGSWGGTKQGQRRNPPPTTPPATSARRVPACDLRRRAPWPHRPAVAPPLLGPATARRRPRPSRLRGSAA